MTLGEAFFRIATAAIILADPIAISAQGKPPGANAGSSAGLATTEQFTIGPEDEIGVLFWKEAEISQNIVVRPDGIVTIQLLGEIRADGLTPMALASDIQARATRYLTDPQVTVVVRRINSRKVYVTGEVNAPGAYPLTAPRTVIQVISLAGGLLEYARSEEITILRKEDGQTRSFRFNYKDVSRGRSLDQNLELRPGDTIVVP
jgi:polysaccharide export outer membrane protein